MQEPKKPSHVRGIRINCNKFEMCPLCYGCRAYTTSNLECEECLKENKKKNICNTELHKSDAINKLISKSIIIVNEPIIIKNARK